MKFIFKNVIISKIYTQRKKMKSAKWFSEVTFENGLDIKSLLETENSKEIRIVMPKDEIMKEHKAPGAIVVQVLKGKIWFEVEGQRYEFESGDMLALDAKIPHSLGGLEDSIIRLTLSKIDHVKRVKDVAKG